MKVSDQRIPATDQRTGGVHFDDIVAARRLLSRELSPTPFLTHPLLSKRLGLEAWVKLENAQALGSFKVRGGLNLLHGLDAAHRARGLVTASRGNHGQSLAHAAALHGVRCTVYVPEGNNPDKNEAMTALGATVRIAGHDFDSAWDAAVAEASTTGALAIHPSREPRLVAGYATVALEMLDQATQRLDAVFIPVGGGSLAAGMALVFKALSPHTRLIGVQAEAAPALARAWRTGELVEVPVKPTLADGLATRVPGHEALDILRWALDDMVEVSEAELHAAIRTLAETLHQLAEGAGAAALAGATRLRKPLAGQRVGVVLSGGNIDAATLLGVLHGETAVAPREADVTQAIGRMDYGYH